MQAINKFNDLNEKFYKECKFSEKMNIVAMGIGFIPGQILNNNYKFTKKCEIIKDTILYEIKNTETRYPLAK